MNRRYVRRPGRIALALASVVALPVVTLTPISTASAPAAPGVSPPAECDTEVYRARFPSIAQLRAWNQRLAARPPFPTASPAHNDYLGWLEGQLRKIPGLELSSVPFDIDRWQERPGSSLSVRGSDGRELEVAIAGPAPYTKPAPDGVTAPLTYVPSTKSISSSDVRGKIVLRDAPLPSIPYAMFVANAYFLYDPDLSIDLRSQYQRDYLGEEIFVKELDQAAAAGAVGVLFVAHIPRKQALGYFEPYQGLELPIPALHLGVDEGHALKNGLAAGNDLEATIVHRAGWVPAQTRSLVARLPGATASPPGDGKIWVTTHTDGMNAVQENGPIALLALATYLAKLPQACRPRTIDFGFSTGHFQSYFAGKWGGAAEHHAHELDAAYDDGSVAFVLGTEHLGAREWEYAPRAHGKPGYRLELTGRSEPTAYFVTESPAIIGSTIKNIVRQDLRRSIVMSGSDSPGARLPVHCSLSGEGSAYARHLLPVLMQIQGPGALYSTFATMDQLVNFRLMRSQAIGLAGVIDDLGPVPRPIIAGASTTYRALRDAGLDNGGCPTPDWQ